MYSILILLLAGLKLTSMCVNAVANDTNKINLTVNGSSEIYLSVTGSTKIYAAANGTCDNVADSELTKQRKIQKQIFDKMTSITNELWNSTITPKHENIQMFPLLHVIRDNIMLIEFFHEYGLSRFYPKDKFLQLPFALARMLNKLQKYSFITLKIKNALFYDDVIPEEYMHDMKNDFYSNITTMYAMNNSDGSKNLINKWISENTIGRTPEKENLWTPGLKNFQAVVLEYSACWHSLKSIPTNNSVEMNKQLLLFRAPKSNFEGFIKICVDALSSTEMLGYHNDVRVGYHAIRVPYENTDFAIAVILPHENKDLEFFLNFTTADYTMLLDGISAEKEYIQFTLPTLNLPMITINENGTQINSDKVMSCSLPQPYESWNLLEGHEPKRFFVDKPFGILIYHEITKFVFYQAWIRNPKSKFYVSHTMFLEQMGIRGETNTRSENFERKFIF